MAQSQRKSGLPVSIAVTDTLSGRKTLCPSFSSAQRLTDVRRNKISAICSNGGGFVGSTGYHFRFAADEEKEKGVTSSKEAEEENATAIVPRLQTNIASAAAEVASLPRPVEIPDHCKKEVHTFNATTTNNKEISTGKKNKKPFKLEPFDVSTLLPLTRLKDKKVYKHKVELLCKLTGSIHLCFSNKKYAAQALGLSLANIHRICKSYGKPFHEDDKLPFCQLRYVQTSKAYEYGAHPRDFFRSEETHKQRLKRWAQLQKSAETSFYQIPDDISDSEEGEEEEVNVDHNGDDDSSVEIRSSLRSRPTNKRSKPAPSISKAKRRRRSAPSNSRQSIKTKTDKESKNKAKLAVERKNNKDRASNVAIQQKNEAVASFLDGSTVWPASLPTLQSEMTCIACQNTKASILFYPCHHCVLCQECSEKCCPVRCPLCLRGIKERSKPNNNNLIWIQPKIHGTKYFSHLSFLNKKK